MLPALRDAALGPGSCCPKSASSAPLVPALRFRPCSHHPLHHELHVCTCSPVKGTFLLKAAILLRLGHCSAFVWEMLFKLLNKASVLFFKSCKRHSFYPGNNLQRSKQPIILALLKRRGTECQEPQGKRFQNSKPSNNLWKVAVSRLAKFTDTKTRHWESSFQKFLNKIAHHEAAIWDLHSGASRGTYRSVSLWETQQRPARGFKPAFLFRY